MQTLWPTPIAPRAPRFVLQGCNSHHAHLLCLLLPVHKGSNNLSRTLCSQQVTGTQPAMRQNGLIRRAEIVQSCHVALKFLSSIMRSESHRELATRLRRVWRSLLFLKKLEKEARCCCCSFGLALGAFCSSHSPMRFLSPVIAIEVLRE